MSPDLALAALLHRLGGTPSSQSPDGDGGLHTIGTLHGLQVWGAPPQADVAAVARRLARAGRIGLLLGHHRVPGHGLAAVTLGPVRVVHLPAESGGVPLARRIARLAARAEAPMLARAVALSEAIDLDGAGRRTFVLLHDLIERGVEALPAQVPRADRHAWLLMHCTRLLFLRFVEAEGWLDGSASFLADQFDRVLRARRDPLTQLLEPLFFGTLNRPDTERLRAARAFGRIPFLNGGLFEPHPIERRWRLSPPVAWWEEAFTAFTGRIEVTLDHEPLGGEVTPEMLGRVFEGVMAADERKDAGAFYTPPALVRALAVSALAPLLAARLGVPETGIERRLADPDPVLLGMLADLRLLDPAVGSGAFLIGALDLLHGPGPRQPRRTARLVTRALHGIDRHPGAVRITELRLWLEVLRPLRGLPPERIPPLPNLDAAVRSGDALLDPLQQLRPGSRAGAAASAHRRIAVAHGREKQRLLACMRGEERQALIDTLERRNQQLEQTIHGHLEAARAPTLFGRAAGLGAESRTVLRALRQERATIRRELRAVARDQHAAPFAPAIAFAEILERRGGFDLVIGNPPWVRAERVPSRTRQALAARYRWWRGHAGRGFRHQPDLAVAFVERGLELVRPGGTLAMLVPGKLATTQYASAMREGLSRRTTLRCVADLADDPRASFGATTYPMALVAEHTLPTVAHRVRLSLNDQGETIAQRLLAEHDRWPLGVVPAHELARRLAAFHPTIGDRFTPQLGVKTGANDVFLDPPASLGEWTRAALRGRDVARGTTRPAARLLWPADDRGNPLDPLPAPMAAYLEPHRGRLARRADLRDGCWWRLFRTAAATAPHRVAWSDLARRLVVVMPSKDAIPLNSCYVIALPDRETAQVLRAWCNATWLRALARLGADPAAQGYARFSARVVGALPLPADVLDHAGLRALGAIDAPVDQERLDAIVADLLGLSAAEQALLAPLATARR